MNAGMPGLSSTERRLARSISSTAATGVCFSRITASQASTTLGNRIRALALWAYSGTVR